MGAGSSIGYSIIDNFYPNGWDRYLKIMKDIVFRTHMDVLDRENENIKSISIFVL